MALTGVLEDQILKIHTAKDGQVWYVDGGHAAINTHAPIEDFLTGDACQRARHVRMAGSAGNAQALCLMFGRKLDRQLLRLEVASPAVLGRTRAERNDPRLMLVRMRGSAADGLNPAMGGWHEFGDDDYPAYAIAAYKDHGKQPFDECSTPVELLVRHPAWAGLSFIKHVDMRKLATLLGIILDPRWYVSLRTPHHGGDIVPYYDDAAKLHAYLGLDPRTMAGVLGYCEPTGSYAMCRLVLETWASVGAPSEKFRKHPAYFLWRRYHREGAPIKGALRASQMFVDYIRLVWLDSLYCDYAADKQAPPGKRPRREGLFAPDHFFSRSEEAAAYMAHRAATVAN
jgi:hypothetical protein